MKQRRKSRLVPEPISPATGPCFACGKVVSGDFYCYGCKEYICDGCDKQCIEHENALGAHVRDVHVSDCEMCIMEGHDG